ncbi:MAG: hypothetical protein HQL60_06995 [Magnetococcales bacterium]|nr:hypothetical protein [Magnetococcales bacterium]
MNAVNTAVPSATTARSSARPDGLSVRSSGSSAVATSVNATATNGSPSSGGDAVTLAAPERVNKAIDALVREVLDTLLNQPVDFKNPPFKAMDPATVNRLVGESAEMSAEQS